MKWQFNVPTGTTNNSFNAEIICNSAQMEQIKVTGKNVNITILGNRPLIEAIERPYPIPVSWRVIQGEINDSKLLNLVTQSVEDYIKKNAAQKNVAMFKEVRKTA